MALSCTTDKYVMAYNDNVIYDTGNMITTLFRLDTWDYEHKCFKEHNLLLHAWNLNIEEVKPTLINGANSCASYMNLIIFKNPV